MGKHLMQYGAGTLKTGAPSYHSLESGDLDTQAQKVIEGDTRFLNPWRLVWASAPGAIVSPGKLEIILDDPFWGGDSEELAVLWDTETLVSKSNVEEGTTVFVDVPAINGEVLQIWMTDENALSVRMITNQREAQETERAVHEKKKQTFTDTLTGAAEGVKASTSNLKWTVVTLAVVALGGYLLLKFK